MSFLGALFSKRVLTMLGGNNIFLVLLIGLLAIIIVPNYNNIKEKLGFQTKTTLVKDLTEEKNKVKDLTIVNKDLNDTIINNENSKKNSIDTIIRVVEKDKETDIKTSDIIKKKKTKIAQIKAGHEIVIRNIDNENIESIVKEEVELNTENAVEIEKVEQEKAISAIQIASVWEAYCEYSNCASAKG